MECAANIIPNDPAGTLRCAKKADPTYMGYIGEAIGDD
jgi:hypothetical protein